MPVVYLKHKKVPHKRESFLRHLKKRKASVLVVSVAFLLGLVTLLAGTTGFTLSKQQSKIAQIQFGQIQGVMTGQVFPTSAANLPSPTPQEVPPTPTPTIKLSKSYYTIALYGDSLEDTMGERLEYLEGALKKKYPDTTFFLYNYGIGSQNAEDGLNRFNEDFKYKDRDFPAISKIQADVIVIGSFAYNPFTPHDKNRHWLNLTQIVKEAQKKKDAQVYLMAEIAPLRRMFGKGPGGVNWDENTAFEHSGHIVEQLEATISLAKALNVPLIDIYHKSLKEGSLKEGKRELVDTNDGIHPGVEGQKFEAEEIANDIELK